MMENKEYFITLFNEYLSGTIDPLKEQAFHEMLQADAHKKAFFDQVMQLEAVPQHRINIDEVFAKHLKAIAKEPLVIVKHTKKRYWLRIAAAALILIIGGLAYYSLTKNTEQYKLFAQTANGERKFYKLSDGTEIWLNSGSVLHISNQFGTANRNIQLSGEGYFHVAKNAQLPFIINTEQADVKVVGTIFNVRAYPDEQHMETALVEGKVELTVHAKQDKKIFTLIPGEKIVIDKHQDIVKNDVADNAQNVVKTKINYQGSEATDALWRQNKLSFDGDSIPVVMSKLEKWYGKKVVIKEEAINKMSFTGIFQSQPIADVLKLIKESGAINGFNEEGNKIIIY